MNKIIKSLILKSYINYNKVPIMAQTKLSVIPSESKPFKIEISPLKGEILKFFKKLNDEIQQMNNKISNIVEKSSGQFIIAYNNHIENVKKQMKAMEKNIQQHEKQFENSHQVLYLKKQIVLFREQSIKWYDKFQQNKQILVNYKNKVQSAEDCMEILKNQVKELIRSKKLFQIQLTNSQKKILQLQQQLNQKQEQIRQINLTAHTKVESLQSNNTINTITDNINLSPNIKNLTQQQKNSKNICFTTKNKPSHASILNKDNELKLWFINCIKSIKKQIATRKINGLQLNLNSIGSIQQFKIFDKMKLMQKFIENEKLLVWMYEKIFPSRSNQINQYLSRRKIIKTEPSQFQTTDNQSNIIKQLIEEEENDLSSNNTISLPKIALSKNMKGKNRMYVITKGKLSISKYQQCD